MKRITIEIDENTRGGRILERGLDGLIDALIGLDRSEIDFCQHLDICEGEMIFRDGVIPRERCRKCLEEWLNAPAEGDHE